jgi:alanine racemase
MRAPTGAVTGTIADSKKDAKTPKLVSSESTTDSAHGVHNLREATIDLTAKTYNTVLVAKAAGSARPMAIVKADGFGHGVTQIAETALRHGASWVGVTC